MGWPSWIAPGIRPKRGGHRTMAASQTTAKKKVDKKHHDRLVQIAQFIKTIAQAVGEKFPQKEVDKCKLLTDILLSDILDNAKGALRKTLSLMLTIRQANFACITSPLGKYGMYVSNGLKASPKDNIVLSLDSSKKKAEMKATVQYFYGYKTPSFTLTLTIQLSLNTKTGVFETKNYSDFNISLTDIVHLFSLRDRKEIKNIKHYMSCLDKNARFPPDSEQGGKRGLWVGAEEVCGLPGLEQQFTPTITHRLHCSYGSGVQAQEARALCYQLGVTSSRSKNWNLLPIGLRNSLVASV
mmetsp:Transcript_6650/g.16765  ORF Transcript_6650/g.16765 Transcript_6650/m.16765 type:complete len:297 (+) Transcript_6650:359-1249(+)